MFERAARRVPDQPQPLIELARISETLGDWADARTRWRGLIDRFNLPLGMAREAWALKELGQPEAAEAALERILPNHSRDLDIALVRAHLAESRGDLPAACERWQFIRRINAFFPAGYQEGARCLFMVERYAEADTVMRDAMERFPAEAWPLRGYGHLAHDRQEWAMAAERWLELRRRFPSDQVAASLGISALRAAGREDEAAALERGA